MPIYEYRCEKCGKVFELLRHIDDHNTVQCVQCGSTDTKKLIASHTSFQLRGTGWYETDFKNGETGSHDGSAGGKE